MLLRKRVITTIMITTLATMILGGSLGMTSILSIEKIKQQIQEEQQAINDRFAMHRYIRDEVTKINETRTRLRDLADMSLAEGHELDLITALEKTASVAGVEQEISLETVNQKEISSWEMMVPIRLKVSGAYLDFIDYLRRLDDLDYLISIQSFTVSQQNSSPFDKDHLGLIRSDLTANVYWTSENRPQFLNVDDLEVPQKISEQVSNNN